MELNSVVMNLKYSVIREINELAKEYEGVIQLTIGEPDVQSPKALVAEVLEYGKSARLTYPPTGGGIEIREKVAHYYNKTYGSDCSESNIIMNIGSSEALSSALRTILNPGDEVIVPAPYYPGYIPMIKMAYGVPVVVDTTKSNFILTPEILESYIGEKTKAILLSNPCNPTGKVMSKNEIERLADYLEDKNIFLISDEIYSALSFGDFFSFGACKNIKDKLIIVNGFSKSHSLTGWRIGYTIVPEKIRKFFLNATLYNVSSPMALSLQAAKIALDKFACRKEISEIYRERAYYLRDRLNSLGFQVVEPKGAFYLFVGYSQISEKNSLDFCLELLKETRVAVVPGIAFGSERYFRIALTQELHILKEVVDRLETFLKK
ncbi:MAG: pyridoxal phosphate-dependent aminotransferase [Fusobacteriaceae bacterium]